MTHGRALSPEFLPTAGHASGGAPPAARGPAETSPIADYQGFPIPETAAERAIVDRIRSISRGVYVALAFFPISGFGIHLRYRRDVSIGWAFVLFLFGPLVWIFHGLPSSLYWSLVGGRSWTGLLAERARMAIESCRALALTLPAHAEGQRQRDAVREVRNAEYLRVREARAAEEQRKRSERHESERRELEKRREIDRLELEARLEKERLEREQRLEAARREQASRDAALVLAYGGNPKFVQLVREGSICLGMTGAAVKASWGEPAAVKEEISAKRRRARLFYGKQVGARGKVSYRHEIVLLNDRVVEMNDL